MKEFMNQHGETVLAGTAAALVISVLQEWHLEEDFRV